MDLWSGLLTALTWYLVSGAPFLLTVLVWLKRLGLVLIMITLWPLAVGRLIPDR